MRISTTVDGTQLERCRRYLGGRTSDLMDRALRLLADELEHEREAAALERNPYEDDPELAWTAPPGPDLPYEGRVPDDLGPLAAARRACAGR